MQDTYDLILNRHKQTNDKTADGRKRKAPRSRVILRMTVKFTTEHASLSMTATDRQDIGDVLRVHLTGSDVAGGHGGALSNDVARIAAGELVPLENTATCGFNFRVWRRGAPSGWGVPPQGGGCYSAGISRACALPSHAGHGA